MVLGFAEAEEPRDCAAELSGDTCSVVAVGLSGMESSRTGGGVCCLESVPFDSEGGVLGLSEVATSSRVFCQSSSKITTGLSSFAGLTSSGRGICQH